MIDKNVVIEKYKELGNIWKVASCLGLSGQWVYEILNKEGVVKHINKFSKEDERFLMDNYKYYADRMDLSTLAELMGRTKQFICRKAKSLGLTNSKRKYKLSDSKKQEISHAAKNRIKKYGHPKGMLGKKQSEDFKSKMSKRMINTWRENPKTFMTEKRIRVMSDKMSQMQKDGILNNKSRCYNTKVYWNDNVYNFKSNWELNISFYLEYLRLMGEIKEWSYETKHFLFDLNTYGVRRYTPDFFIITNDNKEQIIELKGWLDEKSKNKIELMKEVHPKTEIELWDEIKYREIEKNFKHCIKVWDYRKTIKNDNLCVKIIAEKYVDKDNPRVEFKIITID